MHALYYAEQAYLALSSVILTILFGCQLLEKRPGQQIGKLKALYHWLGFVGSVVLLVRSIDPRGFWGILDRWLIYSLLGNTCTSILLACTSAAVWFSLLSFTQVVLQGGQNKCTLAAGVVLKVSTGQRDVCCRLLSFTALLLGPCCLQWPPSLWPTL